MLAVAPVPWVAICQMPMNTRKSAIETIAARKRREEVISLAPLFFAGEEVKRKQLPRSRRLPDLEAGEIIVWFFRIEALAHHGKRLVARRRRHKSLLRQHLACVRRRIDLLLHRFRMDIAL